MKNLKHFKKNIYSQNGEDGIISEIFLRLNLQDFKNFWVVEFGAWDGKHLSNTFNLIEKGASSVLIEGDSQRYLDLLETQKTYKNIHPIQAFVGGTNEQSLDYLLNNTPIKDEYEVLSIDVDSYENLEIWKNYSGNPMLVIIEANSAYLPFEKNVPRDLGNSFFETNKIANQKGYTLIAHTPNHVYIKKDLVNKIYGERGHFNVENLYNFNNFIKWRQLSRGEILRLLISNFKLIYTLPFLVKLLPLKFMHYFVEKFYKLN